MIPHRLAFEHLNLWRNPFGQPSSEDWPRLAVVDVDRFVERLMEDGHAVQFTGHQGRGKSTHMRAIHARFPGSPFIHIGPGDRPTIPHAPRLFLDETQRISWWKRERLFRRPGLSLIIGTHRDHTAQLRRCGLHVETVQVEGLTAKKLREVIDRRLEWARREPGAIPWLDDATVEALIVRFGDDLRSIGYFLYDAYQRLDGPGRVQLNL